MTKENDRAVAEHLDDLEHGRRASIAREAIAQMHATHDVLDAVERSLDDSGRLDSVAGLLAELDETAISITVVTDHLSRLSDRLAEVRKKMRALVTLDRMEAHSTRKRSSIPPPAVDE